MTTPLTRIPQNAGVPGFKRMLVRWLAVAAPCTFWFWPFPPVQDLLAHAALLEATTRGTDSLWTSGPWYGHSAMFYAAGGLVARQVGGLLAARLIGIVATALIPLGTWRMARSLGGDEDLGVLGGGVLALGHLSFLGFLPFQAALGLILCLLPELVRARSLPVSLAAACSASALAWSLHALSLPALWIGLLVLAPDQRRRLAVLAAIPIPVSLWLVTRSGSESLILPQDPTGLWIRLERLWRFFGSADRWSWPLPGLGILALIANHAACWRRASPATRRAGFAFLGFATLGMILPDFLEKPRIVHPWIRMAPFAGALLVASLPREAVRRVHRVLAAGLLASCTLWILVLAGRESRLLEAPATALRSMPPSQVLLGVTLHRPLPGSWTRLYGGLHLPFLYQAEDRGTTLAPFTHEDSPVRLKPEAAAVADLALKDVRRYVTEGSRFAVMALTDGGNDPFFLRVSGLDGLPPCPVPFPLPWRCVILPAHTAPH